MKRYRYHDNRYLLGHVHKDLTSIVSLQHEFGAAMREICQVASGSGLADVALWVLLVCRYGWSGVPTP